MAMPSIACSVGPSAEASRHPSSLSGMSVRPVCLRCRLHIVSPWRISTTRSLTPGTVPNGSDAPRSRSAQRERDSEDAPGAPRPRVRPEVFRAPGSSVPGEAHETPGAGNLGSTRSVGSPGCSTRPTNCRDGPPPATEAVEVRRRSGLTPKTLQQTVPALAGSWSVAHVVLRETGALVGMGRVIGDGGWYFHITDMCVDPDHQRRGIGDAVLTRLIDGILAATPAEPVHHAARRPAGPGPVPPARLRGDGARLPGHGPTTLKRELDAYPRPPAW